MDHRTTYSNRGIYYRQYNGETDLQHIMDLVENELSEPYVIYTFRYFLQGWPNLSFLAFPEAADGETHATTKPIGVIVCKQSIHRGQARRGYIAMLSVDRAWRKRGIASTMVKLSIDMMTKTGADEIVLEAEVDNPAALALYSSLGFIREKRLYRFYMSGKDAFRLVLPVISGETLVPDVTITSTVASMNEERYSASSTAMPIAVPFSTALPKVATLDSPPSPTYPIRVPLGGGSHSPSGSAGGDGSPVDRNMLSASMAGGRFAKGGLLGAALPRSVDSTDSFTLYGAHIPSSISPPLPPRAPGSVRPTPVRYDDDDDYTSGR